MSSIQPLTNSHPLTNPHPSLQQALTLLAALPSVSSSRPCLLALHRLPLVLLLLKLGQPTQQRTQRLIPLLTQHEGLTTDLLDVAVVPHRGRLARAARRLLGLSGLLFDEEVGPVVPGSLEEVTEVLAQLRSGFQVIHVELLLELGHFLTDGLDVARLALARTLALVIGLTIALVAVVGFVSLVLLIFIVGLVEPRLFVQSALQHTLPLLTFVEVECPAVVKRDLPLAQLHQAAIHIQSVPLHGQHGVDAREGRVHLRLQLVGHPIALVALTVFSFSFILIFVTLVLVCVWACGLVCGGLRVLL
mmetsp:Transcript_7172/g.20716  ORF Transcript_7172/g.20716 Transcript_7172/m.20716 type:complete len:304 (-) Transcript_7172:798-1709(-)